MSQENVEIVRRSYEANNFIGRTSTEFLDLGHAVLVETSVFATGRGSDVPIEFAETDVFWFRDGMIVRLQGFATNAEALEAVGLSERTPRSH